MSAVSSARGKRSDVSFFSSGDLPVYIEPYIFDASAAHNKENIAIVWLISVHITPKFYMVFISATVEESAGESQV